MAKKFVLPDEPGKTIADIERAADRVLEGKAAYFAGKSSVKLAISSISPNANQPRKYFDDEKLAELKQSLEVKGLIEPIVVRPLAENRYEIVCGERRWRAAKELDWKNIDVVIKEMNPDESFELALLENIQREDLTPIEEAEAFKHLIDRGMVKNQTELAKTLGITRQAVSYKMSLLSLPESIKSVLSTQVDKVTETHLRNFHKLESEDMMFKVFNAIIENGLSVKGTDIMIDKLLAGEQVNTERTIQSRFQQFSLLENNKKHGIWIKYQGEKFVVEAKGAQPGRESDPKVQEALTALHNALYS